MLFSLCGWLSTILVLSDEFELFYLFIENDLASWWCESSWDRDRAYDNWRDSNKSSMLV